MTTETTGAGETTNQPAAGAAGAAGEASTILGGGDPAKTAGVADGAAKGADAGAQDGAKAGEGDAAKAADAKTDDKPAAGPPEKYEFTMPEGVELDAAMLEKAEPVLRELGLTNEQANKLAATLAEHRVSEAQKQTEAYAQQVEDWGKAARDDKEFGGAAFTENVAAAQKAIAEFGTPELTALLKDGLGNHPELIRFCVRIGKTLGEDKGTGAKNATGATKSAAEVLYNHPTSQRGN